MKRLHGPPAPRADRPASALLHDEDNVRVVAFSLLPRQVVPAHSSHSSVLVHVLRGSGRFLGAAGTAGALALEPGQSAVYEAEERHSIEAGEAGLEFLAVIAPAPR